MNEFKQYLIDNYNHNTLADIANRKCDDGLAGMSNYTQTNSLYLKFARSIHEAVKQHVNETGRSPILVTNDVYDFDYFSFSIVWFATEWFAWQITGGQYVEADYGFRDTQEALA